MRKYDRPTTFFYLDPPYFGLPYYKFNFTEENYIELANLLKTLKGRFLLSLNDRPEVREIFNDFKIHGLTFSYSSQRKAGKTYKEVLISNYSLPIETINGGPPPQNKVEATPVHFLQDLKNPEAAAGHQNIGDPEVNVEQRAASGDRSPEPRTGNRAA